MSDDDEDVGPDNAPQAKFVEAMVRLGTVRWQNSNEPVLEQKCEVPHGFNRELFDDGTLDVQYVQGPLSQRITVDDVVSNCKTSNNSIRLFMPGKRRPEHYQHFH